MSAKKTSGDDYEETFIKFHSERVAVVKMSNKDAIGTDGSAVSAKSLADLISEEISEEEKVVAKPAAEKITPKKSVAPMASKKTKRKAVKKSSLKPKGPKTKESKIEKAKAAFRLRSEFKPRKPENPAPESMALFNSPPIPPGPSFPGQASVASTMQNRMPSSYIQPKILAMPSHPAMVRAANYMNMQNPQAASMNRPPMSPSPYNRGAPAMPNRQVMPSIQANFTSRAPQLSQNIPPRNPHVSGNVQNSRFAAYQDPRASSPASRPNVSLNARPNMPFNRKRF